MINIMLLIINFNKVFSLKVNYENYVINISDCVREILCFHF